MGLKILGKKFGAEQFLFIPLVGGWVCLYKKKRFHNIA
jgi:hypothetical protein